MKKTFTHKEALEDGTTKVSVYDAQSHKLLSYYHLNSEGQKHGMEVEYNDNGYISTKREYIKGKKHGMEVEYNDNGYISTKREYENGECIEYDVPLSEIKDFLEENVLAGRYLLRHYRDARVRKENGQYKSIEIYPVYMMQFKNNKEFSGYLKHFPDSHNEYVEQYYTYRDGVLDGKVRLYDYDGTYSHGQFTGDKKISIPTPLAKKILTDIGIKDYEDGSFYQKIENDKAISEHYSFGYHATMKSGYYTNFLDIYDGIATFSHKTSWSNLDKHKIWTCEMKDGKKNGVCTDYRNKVTMVYADDILDGPYIKFYDKDMQIKEVEYSYKQGKIDGAYTEFFKNQRKKIEGFYKDGKKNGIWKYYSEDGKLINTEFWQNGKNKTEKFNAIKKVAAKHTNDKEPTTKIGKAIQKTIKSIEVGMESKKLQKQKAQKRG